MKTSVSFYQLENIDHLYKHICDICFRLYTSGHHVFILCKDNKICLELDEYILNYQINNYFPYQIIGDGPIPPAPICLGIEAQSRLKYDILINLHSIIPDNFIKYRQVIEFVPADEDLRNISREHYKHYKKLGLNIEFQAPSSLDSEQRQATQIN